MTTLSSSWKTRPYTGEADVSAIAALINHCLAVDHSEDQISVNELRHQYESQDFNIERDLRLWVDATGELCAVASCWLPPAEEPDQPAHFGFSIHPQVRNQGLEAEIIHWAEDLARQVARDRQKSVKLRSGCRTNHPERMTLLEAHGFTAERTFYRMQRSLTTPIPAPQLPEGFQVRCLHGDSEVEAWVEAFNQSFIDHWNFRPLTVEQRRHWMTAPDYVPDADLVAVAADGTIASLCLVLIRAEENKLTGRSEGWIGDLATRRGYRRQGLGRAMLLHGLQTLKAKGLDTALLAVDSTNPTGALRLYESVGFQAQRSTIAYVKPL